MSHNNYISQGQRQRKKDENQDYRKRNVEEGKTRSESMPARDTMQDNSKKRRHRIFQDSLGLFQNDQTESQKRNRSCIFPKKTADKNQNQQDKTMSANISPFAPAQIQSVTQQQKPNQIIQSSVQAKRLSLQLRKKQKEVQYLKLEIERYRRCEKISRENESLYQKISEKLQDTPQNIKMINIRCSDRDSEVKNAPKDKGNKSPVKITEEIELKKGQNQKERNLNGGSNRTVQKQNSKDKEITPIHSLQDIKFTSERSSSKRKLKQADKQANILKNAVSVDPISETSKMYKTTPQPIASYSPNQQSAEASQTLTFNHRSHSKQKPQAVDIQSNLQRIQDKFYSTRRLGRIMMGDIPINRRLQQMNRLLEGNSRYKHSSQHGTASKYRPEPKSPNHL